MKRDINLSQLALFEPDPAEAANLMKAHAMAFERLTLQAGIWDDCWCPGARDQCLREAQGAFESWLVAALYLDFEREAAL